MGLEIPAEVQSLSWIVGSHWPEGDETVMRRCAEAWRQSAADIKELIPDLRRDASNVLDSVQGAAADEFERHWNTFVTTDPRHLPELAERCERLAAQIEKSALDIEYAKYLFIVLLTTTATEIAELKANAVNGTGMSAAGIPAVQAAAQVTSRAIFNQLLTAIADHATVDAAGQVAPVAMPGAARRDTGDAAIDGEPSADPGAVPASASVEHAPTDDQVGTDLQADTNVPTGTGGQADTDHPAGMGIAADTSVPTGTDDQADADGQADTDHPAGTDVRASADDPVAAERQAGASAHAAVGDPADVDHADHDTGHQTDRGEAPAQAAEPRHAAAPAGAAAHERVITGAATDQRPSDHVVPTVTSAATSAGGGTSLAGAEPADVRLGSASLAAADPAAMIGPPTGDQAGGIDAPAAGEQGGAPDGDAEQGEGAEGGTDASQDDSGSQADAHERDAGTSGGGMYGPYGMYGGGMSHPSGGGGHHAAGSTAMPRDHAPSTFLPSGGETQTDAGTQDADQGVRPATQAATALPAASPFSSAFGEGPSAAPDAPASPYVLDADAALDADDPAEQHSAADAEGRTDDAAAGSGPAVFVVPPRLNPAGGGGGARRRPVGSGSVSKPGSRPRPRSAAATESVAHDHLLAEPGPRAEVAPAEIPEPPVLPARLRAAYDLSEATPAGRSLYGPGEPDIREFARRVRPDPDRYVLDGCGTPSGMWVGDRELPVADIADIVRGDPGWGGRELVLLSCGAARGDAGFAGFAADLARNLGVSVITSSDLVWSDARGRVFAAPAADQPARDGRHGQTWPPDRGWRTFHPDSVPAPPGPDAVVVADEEGGDGLTELGVDTVATTGRAHR